MPKGWKTLAERADRTLHTSEQVRDAIPLALADSWRDDGCDEFVRQIKDVLLGGDQDTLFRPSKEETAQAIRKLSAAGHTMRFTLAEAVTQAVEAGHSGETALAKGAADALAIRCSAGARSAEEHYLRVSNERRASDVRSRIEEGASLSDFNSMARQFCKLEKAAPAAKYDGLDDGVLTR
jgi:hypothetical protein